MSIERRLPKRFNKETSRSVEHAHDLAAGDYTTGLCPVCNQPMVLSSLKQAGNRPVYVCLEHRVCLPLSKEENTNV